MLAVTLREMAFSRPASLPAEGVRAACLYFALTLVLAYPLSVHPATSVLPMGADTNLLLWLLQWDVHALTTDPLSIFDANIYYPFRNTLAYAENVIGSALIAAPVLWTTHNAVLALNVVALLSCVLCGAGTYVLARRVGISPLGAALAGLIFAFGPPRFFRLGQLHLTTIQWVPFCLAFVHGYLDSGRPRDLWWACAFLALQVLTSGHGTVFAVIGVAALLLWRVALGEPIAFRKWLRDGMVPVVLLAEVAFFVFLPYRAVQDEMNLRRSLGESYLFSPNAASFFASPTHLHAFVLAHVTSAPVLQQAKAFLFPGYLTLLLALASLIAPTGAREGPTAAARWARAALVVEILLVAALIAAVAVTAAGGVRLRLGPLAVSARQPWRAWLAFAVLAALRAALIGRAPFDMASRARGWPGALRRWREANRRSAVAFYAVLAALSFWLSLGPEFGLYRLVYSWPGFSFIRVPSRFTLLTLLALAVMAGAGFDRLTARLATSTRRVLAIVAGAILVAEFFGAPLNALPYRIEIPAVDRWLALQPTPFVVAELPLANAPERSVNDERQSLYMLHSTAHWQKTIHGFSGLQPPLHDDLYSELLTFPNESILKKLASLGVTYVVVHAALYPADEWHKVEDRLRQYTGWLTLRHTDGADRVYALRERLDVSRGPDAAR
jgi:hypothetical protein